MTKRTRTVALFIFFLVFAVPSNRATANNLNGTLELDYSDFKSTSKDGAGNTVKTKSTDFNQQYNLYMNVTPFPNLTLAGRAIVAKDALTSDTGGVTSDFSDTNVRPSLEITLRDPLNIYAVGAGYSKSEETTKGSGSPAVTYVNEIYNATMGWTPIRFPTFELPSFNLQATRSNLFDKAHLIQDQTSDTVLFSTRYTPRPGLDLNYSAFTNDTKDKVTVLELQTQRQTASVVYTDTFWNGRVSLTSGYNISLEKSKTSQQGEGEVSIQLFPFVGFSSVSDSPATPDTLGPNGSLIDGNLTSSAAVNIGSSPSLIGDIKVREMGVDFSVNTEVNNVLIWVNEPLPPEIANSFTWDIYTSENNLTWTLLPGVPQASFGPFVNRFTIDFQNVTTRYLKVVTHPLSAAVPGATGPNYLNIFVTEMQVFLKKPAAEIRGDLNRDTQTYNVNIQTQIVRGVSYFFSYNLTRLTSNLNGTETTSQQHYLSQGLFLSHRFNLFKSPVLTASAQVSHDETYNNITGRQVGSYNYNAILTAVPLNTLRGSLVYSGTITDHGDRSDGLSLNTTAELYRGVSVNASGGLVSSTVETGERTRSYRLQAGTSIAPRRDLTLAFDYVTSRLVSPGGSQVPGSVTSTSTSNASTTYRPVETVFLTASVSQISRVGEPAIRVRNFGLNWSPLYSGDLQFTFAYNESLQPVNGTKTRTTGPGLTWRVFNGASLDLSYLLLENSSPQQTNDIKSLTVQYRMTFL